MVGSTELSSRLDPEDLRDIMRAFQRSCESAIFGFDGRIGRYMGDGILAYFGFPAAHEDSAERAVQAALEGIRLVSELSFEGVPHLEMRVGIATGLVVIGDLIGEGSSREFALVGDAPNLAARLQQLAKPNQILVAPATRRLLGDLFEFEDLGDLDVKGFLEPIAVSGVLRRSKASRFEARRSGRIAPLIGREAELAVLSDAFEKAKTGQGQMVAVSGEPGIGKSRLVNTFRHQMPPGSCRVFLFQCSSYHLSSPWYPVIRHVDDVLGSGYEARGSNKLERLEALIEDISRTRRASIVPLLAPLLGIPTEGHYPPLDLTPQQQKQRTFLAMVEMLRAHCEQQPVILIAEDIHWIDHTSSQMLELIRDNLPNWRMLLIATFRPEYRSLGGADASISLNRLSPAQVASMVEAIDSEPETADSGGRRDHFQDRRRPALRRGSHHYGSGQRRKRRIGERAVEHGRSRHPARLADGEARSVGLREDRRADRRGHRSRVCFRPARGNRPVAAAGGSRGGGPSP